MSTLGGGEKRRGRHSVYGYRNLRIISEQVAGGLLRALLWAIMNASGRLAAAARIIACQHRPLSARHLIVFYGIANDQAEVCAREICHQSSS